jgi:hypothetical protein
MKKKISTILFIIYLSLWMILGFVFFYPQFSLSTTIIITCCILLVISLASLIGIGMGGNDEEIKRLEEKLDGVERNISMINSVLNASFGIIINSNGWTGRITNIDKYFESVYNNIDETNQKIQSLGDSLGLKYSTTTIAPQKEKIERKWEKKANK